MKSPNTLLMNDRQREKISLMSDKKYIFAITKQNTIVHSLIFPQTSVYNGAS